MLRLYGQPKKLPEKKVVYDVRNLEVTPKPKTTPKRVKKTVVPKPVSEQSVSSFEPEQPEIRYDYSKKAPIGVDLS